MRARVSLTGLLLICSLALAPGCGDEPAIDPMPVTPTASASATPAPVAGTTAYFRDATREAGIHFVHVQGEALIYLPDTSSPGIGMIDIDQDGFDDLLFLQGTGKSHTHVQQRMPPSELYRAAGGGRFEECGAVAGLDSRGWAQACLVWDYDNDGYPDALISNYAEPLQLYHNNGDGTFTEVAARAGVPAPDLVYASSVTAIDVDRDGFQDLYVGQYVRFENQDFLKDPPWGSGGELGGPLPRTLMPGIYGPLPKRLFKNLGNGTFVDATAGLGIDNPKGRTYAAVSADFDGDGWPDLFVANDIDASALFRNDHGKRFIDESQLSWLIADGRGAMGAAVGDFDLDGNLDLAVSHWWVQPALYRNYHGKRGRAGLRFLDRNAALGFVQRPLVGWGIGFLDVDNDGLEDLLQINGDTNPDLKHPGTLNPQPAYLWRLASRGAFEFVDPAPSDPLGKLRVGRGTAFGDLDHDGYVDAAVGNNNQPAELWMNRGGANAWIGFTATGSLSTRDALGVRITLHRGTWHRTKTLASGESFFSANAKQLVFGLGADRAPVTADVWWPSGRTEEFRDLAPSRYHHLIEGAGVAVPPRSLSAATDRDEAAPASASAAR